MIAFVIILALLTFFSNTIMNLTIPKVMGAYASRGNLSYSNNARGTITVDNQTEVKGLDGREVEEVLVTNYDVVMKGDPIIKLKSIEDSEELQSKKDTLTELKRTAEYEERQPSDDPDFSTYYDSINMAKETLSQAKDTLSKVQNKSSVESSNKKIIDEESVKAVSLEASVSAAAETVEGLKKDIDAIDAAIAPLQSQVEVYIALGTPTPTPKPAPGSEDPADNTDPADPADPPYVPDLDENGLDRKSPTYAMEKLLFKISQYEEQKKALESQLGSAQDRLNEASAALAECQGKIDEAKAEIDSLASLPTEQAAKNAVTSAQNSLNAAQKSLNDAYTQAGITRDKTKDAKEDRAKQIEKLTKEIAELEKKIGITEITAPADGYIYNISVSKGDVMTAKDIVAYIIPETDRICSVSFDFSAQAAQNIYIGMDLEVTSGFIEGCTVASIKPDPNNPRGNRIVKCMVQGNDA